MAGWKYGQAGNGSGTKGFVRKEDGLVRKRQKASVCSLGAWLVQLKLGSVSEEVRPLS